MNKLKPNEMIDQQQEKHIAYLKAGFVLKQTRNLKDVIIRTYEK